MGGYPIENCYNSVVSIRGEIITDKDICREIQLEKLLLVEGIDEVYFFNEYVKKLKIEDLEIRDYKGKNNFKNYSPIMIASTAFKKIKSLGVIRDADGKTDCNNNNIQNAFISIRAVLEKIKNDEEINNWFKEASLPDKNEKFSCGNPKIGIFIINPMLENLCLQIVKDRVNMYCVDGYFECLRNNKIFQKNEYKAKILAYLASMQEDVNCIGRAARKNYWDFESECLDDIKKFVKSI